MSRNYRSIAEPKTLNGNVTNVATQITLNNVTGLPSPPYVLVINPDTANEEAVLVTTNQDGVTAPTLKVERSIETGSTAKTHTDQDVVRHMIVGSDLQLVHDHLDNTTTAHGVAGAVVGTTSTQTLTNKTLTTPKLNENVAVTATATEVNVLDGITASTAELNILDGVTSTAAELNILDGATLTTTELNYVDGVTSSIQAQLNALEVFPKGMISPFAGSSATVPTGWLLCDGTTKSRTTYAALFAVIGTTYGAGDGSTTFNLPDLLGRVPMGAGAGTGLTSRTLGTELGVESVTLTALQSGLRAHGHGTSGSVSLNDAGAQTATGSISTGGHGHTLTMAFSGDATHDHAIAGVTNPRPAMTSDGDSPGTISNSNGTAIADVGNLGGSASVSVGNHNHTVTNTMAVTDAVAAPATDPTSIVQPSTVVNFIIKH